MPRIAYWTSAFAADMEAIAWEVQTLRQRFPRSVVWGVSQSHFIRLSHRRGYAVHPRFHLPFRLATRFAQRAFDLNHIFGSAADWYHLVAAHKHPIVLTVAAESGNADREMLAKVDRFAVEWPKAAEHLQALGVDASRIELVFPPVDLQRFRPVARTNSPTHVLFASSPELVDWLDARGVPLLLDVAQQMPEISFRLLWRPWGSAHAVVKEEITRRGLRNVTLDMRRVDDMSAEYAQADITIAPFTDETRCKPCPNSLVESLAAGVPVVLTDIVGIADLVRESDCGAVAPPNVDGLCAAIDNVRSRHPQLAHNARVAAEQHFSLERFLQSYTQIYNSALNNC